VRRRHDLVVLGGGTAGLVSATIAAGLGARVALVERERTGGDCLYTGCVPSKSLLAAAHLAHAMRRADRVGLAPRDPEVDFARVMERVQEAIRTIEPHDAPERLRRDGVEVLEGDGSFVAPGAIEVGGRTLRTAAAIVATGSEPAIPPVAGLEGDDVLTSETLWDLREQPGRLVILGAGAIGCELGQAFTRLGSRVTLVEQADRILTKEEPEASALIARRLAEEGVDLRLATTAVAVRRPAGAPPVLVVDGPGGEAELPFDRVLVAGGRRPRTAGAGLEAAGVALDDRGAVRVDGRLATSAPRVFAAGDVTGLLPFTHVAAHHARVATPNALLGLRRTVDDVLPWATFTDPEVARVGLSVAQARERWGERATVARSDYAQLDRAITDGEPYGFALLVGDPKGRLVGATVAAPGAGEAIAELTAHLRAGHRIDDVSTTVHAYPTLAEGPSRAADDHVRAKLERPPLPAVARTVLGLRRARAALIPKG
jgi:pyruvate/2-oxoglutarate dehydrogenase complex dihydrolipoamide dehydrogenase (E3) component